MNPEDVPDEWVRLAVRANADRNHVDLCGCVAWPERCLSGYTPTQWEHGDEAHTIATVLSAARKAWFVELMGDPEDRAQEAATPDDTVRLCEMARPGEHERRLRKRVAEQIEEDGFGGECSRVYDRCARIARGEVQ